jgi:hypothetical protein
MLRRPPGYERRILALAEALQAAGALPAGSVVKLEAEHDRACGLWRGRACDCEPLLRAGPPVMPPAGRA